MVPSTPAPVALTPAVALLREGRGARFPAERVELPDKVGPAREAQVKEEPAPGPPDREPRGKPDHPELPDRLAPASEERQGREAAASRGRQARAETPAGQVVRGALARGLVVLEAARAARVVRGQGENRRPAQRRWRSARTWAAITGRR